MNTTLQECNKLCLKVHQLTSRYLETSNCLFSCVLVATSLRAKDITCDVHSGYLNVNDGAIYLRHTWLQIGTVIVETNPYVAEDFKKGNVKYERSTDMIDKISMDDKATILLDLMLVAGIDKDRVDVVVNYDSIIAIALDNLPGAKKVMRKLTS